MTTMSKSNAAAASSVAVTSVSTPSKQSLNTEAVGKLAEAKEQHAILLRELASASTGEQASSAVQKFAVVVSKARPNTSDAAWGKMIQDTRSALTLNVKLEPVAKRDAHAEITNLQRITRDTVEMK
jgi:hypothetical protein